MPRRTFLAVRLPVLVIMLLLLLCGLGFGWHYYNRRLALTPAERLWQEMRESGANLRSYHACLKTTLMNVPEESEYEVQIWRDGPERYRLEVTRLAEGKQAGLQVFVLDGERAYLYDPELGDFLALSAAEQVDIPFPALEDYWASILEAGQCEILAEEEGLRHRYYRAEIFPAEPHRYRVREIVWLEAKSLLPVRIETYDAYDCLTQLTVFTMIRINPPLEASLFQVDA